MLESEGLYYFDKAEMSKCCQLIKCDSVSVSRDGEMLLQHYRMGHLNFQYLKQLFSSLFLNNKTFNFQCEICELAKYQRTLFQ